jgi:glyoxylase-like metal-dependent hydrolase (beta-lactamase superfamily II)
MAGAVGQIVRLGMVNAYLVREDDGLTLVDALLLAGDAKRIVAAAEREGAPIVRIALTHGHGDHIGALDALAEQLPGVEVSISRRDAKLLAKDTSLEPGEPAAKVRGSVPGARTSPTRLLAAGDRVGSLEVIAAPGHTPGHVAFLDPRDGTLYCGDAYSTLGGVATTARINPRFPLPGIGTWHRPTALDSARALRALDPARLAPGHGRVVESPGLDMDRAISKGA